MSRGVKVCPHCGELLFADMDVCYGCLYDFKRQACEEVPGAGASAHAMRHNPLATIELDEVEFDEVESDTVAQGESERVPRHRKTIASADDTFDLGRQRDQNEEPQQDEVALTPWDVVVMGKEMEVRLPLAEGLSVGRGEDNDIILRSRLVSRHHLRILPIEGGVAVEDCGATNPAELGGSPLEGTRAMQPGDELRVCETILTLAASA